MNVIFSFKFRWSKLADVVKKSGPLKNILLIRWHFLVKLIV